MKGNRNMDNEPLRVERELFCDASASARLMVDWAAPILAQARRVAYESFILMTFSGTNH
jgi:hypothetical protein